MPDPMLHVPEPKARASGFWIRNRATGAMHYCDAHVEAGSPLWTAWPRLTRYRAYFMEKAVDDALSAAGGTLAQAEGFFQGIRASTFFDQVFGRRYVTGPGTADFSVYFGHNRTGGTDSRGGLVLDDADDATTVTGFSGAAAASGAAQQTGHGPGAGSDSGANAGHGTWGDNATWRSNPTAGVLYGSEPVGSSNQNTRLLRSMGRAVAPETAMRALETGSFTNWNLGMGGGAACTGDPGRNGGSGLVRLSQATLTESTSRDLRAPSTTGVNRLGSGGGYYVVSRMGFTLAAGTTIQLGQNYTGSSMSTRNALQYSGWGRATLFTVDDPTISGTISDGILTEFQVYPAIPFGGALVSG